MTQLTLNQTKYLMLVTEQARRLRIVAENMQRTLTEETLAALSPEATVWPGIPSADEMTLLQTAHAKLDLLISQRGMFFEDYHVISLEERKALFSAALAGTWKA